MISSVRTRFLGEVVDEIDEYNNRSTFSCGADAEKLFEGGCAALP